MSEWETIKKVPNISSDGWETVQENPAEKSYLDRISGTSVHKALLDAAKTYANVPGAIAEPLLKLGTGLIAKPVSEVAGLAAFGKDFITGNKEGDPQGFQRSVQESLTYEPRTAAGSSKYNPLNFIPEAIGTAITKASDIPAEQISGGEASDTLRGALGNLTREAIPQALGFLGVKKAPKAFTAADDFLAKREAALAKKGIDRSVKDAKIKEAQDAGFTLTPATADAGIGSRITEGLVGSPKLQHGAKIKNVRKANELIKKDIGLDEHTPLSKGALEEVITNQGKVYEELRQAGNFVADPDYAKTLKVLEMEVRARSKYKTTSNPEFNSVLKDLKKPGFDAEDAVDLMKALRSESSSNLLAAEKGATSKPQQMALGQFQKKAAKALEDMVFRNLEQTRRGDLSKRFSEARKTIAKSKNYLKAIDEHGNIDARKLGDLMKRGAYFTDEGAKVAKFGAGFPEISTVPHGSMNVPVTWSEGLIGLGGLGITPLSLLYPAGRAGGRKLLLSKAGQKMLGPKSYQPGALSEVARGLTSSPEALQQLLMYSLSQQRDRQE